MLIVPNKTPEYPVGSAVSAYFGGHHFDGVVVQTSDAWVLGNYCTIMILAEDYKGVDEDLMGDWIIELPEHELMHGFLTKRR